MFGDRSHEVATFVPGRGWSTQGHYDIDEAIETAKLIARTPGSDVTHVRVLFGDVQIFSIERGVE